MIGADTAWILTSTALVLLMTLPGLALFYGGLVKATNIISVLIQCFAIACMASLIWLIAGYSLSFSGSGAYIGDFSKIFLAGVGTSTEAGNIPENVFFMFQMTFAIITPALVVGAFVERIKFSAVLWISGLWLLFVYAPVTHWIWGGGWLASMGLQDFAGGLVVHLNCGMAALVIAKMLGSRKGFPNDVKPPHSPVLVFVGAALLWVGWFGFNGGSALAADGAAGMAITVTHISAATAALTWMFIEWMSHGKPTLVGIATGTIAGLATITPASGFVGPVGALIIGVLAGIVCYKMCTIIKNNWNIDEPIPDTYRGQPKNWVKSNYNSSTHAKKTFTELLENTYAKYIIISYNNCGIIPLDELDKILDKFGEVIKIPIEHKTYNKLKGLSSYKRTGEYNDVKEFIWVIKTNIS